MVACGPDGQILRANVAARRLARDLSLTSVDRLLPADHSCLISQSLASRKSRCAPASFDRHCFQWTYRRIARRNVICIEGQYLGHQSTASSWETTMLRQILRQLACGILVTDSRLEVRYANPCAKLLLESICPEAMQEGGLFGSLEGLRRELEPLVARGDGALTVPRAAGQPPLELMVTRLDHGAPDIPDDEELTLICLADPLCASSSFPERLRALYGVTPAEARVADALRYGRRLEAGAEELGIGQPTVRSHVQKLCQKLGAERMAELLWRLNACVATILVSAECLSHFDDIL